MAKLLKIGDPLPNLTLKNQQNEAVKLNALCSTGGLVVFFYPKDDSPGCTAEACAFRDRYEDFMTMGVTVVGISSDSVASHQHFAKKHLLPYTLLSDPSGVAEKVFGVQRNLFGLLAGRETFVFDGSGKLIYHFQSLTNATRHIHEALRALRKTQVA